MDRKEEKEIFWIFAKRSLEAIFPPKGCGMVRRILYIARLLKGKLLKKPLIQQNQVLKKIVGFRHMPNIGKLDVMIFAQGVSCNKFVTSLNYQRISKFIF